MKRLFLTIWICGITLSILHAQPNDVRLPVFHTLSVSPHYGRMEYDITLFRLTDPDFNWLLHLTYASDGFRPFVYSGVAGDNWSLHAGGFISRQIVGKADDEHCLSTVSDSEQKGFLAAFRDSAFAGLNSEWLYENPHHYYYGTDLESDIYTFSCNGMSGRFVIGLDGQARILSGDYVSVDLSEKTTQTKDNTGFQYTFLHPDVSTITCTTPDGYQYVFGGNADALGYTFARPRYPSASDALHQKADITHWMLTSVIAPNGRRMVFHYSPVSRDTDGTRYAYSFCTDIKHMDMPNANFYFSDTLNLKAVTNDYDKSRYATMNVQKTFEKILLLDSITTSDGSFSVQFIYHTYPNKIYDAHFAWSDPSDQTYWDAQKHFLACMTVRNASSEIGRWHFAYQQVSFPASTRQYLHSIEHKSGVKYTFDYNVSETVSRDCTNNFDSIDMAGYLISNPTFGALSRITNPLGCTTTCEFSPCMYDSVRIFKQGKGYIHSSIEPYAGNDLVHPIAITSIRKTDADGTLLSAKTYTYDWHMDNLPNTSRASGDNPTSPPNPPIKQWGIANVDFAIDISSDCPQAWKRNKRYILSPYVCVSGKTVAPVEYPKVVESVYDSGNRFLYRNIYHYDRTADSIAATLDYITESVDKLFGAYDCFSQEYRRNRLLRMQEYDHKGALRRETTNRYCPLSPLLGDADNTGCQTSWQTGKTGKAVYKIFFADTHIREQQITTHETNGVYTTCTVYKYDAKQRLLRKEIWEKDASRFSVYRYPDDAISTVSPNADPYIQGYQGLTDAHRINIPVEIIQGITRNGQSFVTAGTLLLYKAYTYTPPGRDIDTTSVIDMPSLSISDKAPPFTLTYYAPSSTWNLRLSEPLLQDDYIHLSVQDGALRYDNRYEVLSTYSYNNNLRLISKSTIGQPTIFYEWDKTGLYVTKETAGNLCTKYTHIPYVGISSVTSPRGITTYYTYDTLGNIVEVYQLVNGQKMILAAYKYHYHSQQ